ncbi:hypothetical protein M758_1G191800 [Ceratodon purpureus]|nr:hypothetical protein M758_1G191800 [Ceratodon purpureus]
MEGSFMLVSGSLLLVPKFVPSGLSSVSARRPIWKGIGQELGRTSLGWRFCSDRGFLREGFDRGGSGLRIGSNGGARPMLPKVFACLESLDSDNELLSFQNDSSAMYERFDIREARLEHEFKGAAWLRADAYSEQQSYTRYVDSFKKKFAEQEFSALKRRISGQPGSYICLVAVSKVLPKDAVDLTWQDGGKETRVLGTLDVSLHHPSPGEAFGGQGLPYGYIANVCVDKSSRKQGIASTLMESAVQVGRKWGLNAIYVHTHATNNPAYKLYLKKGFEVIQSGSPQNLVDGNLLLRLQM